MPMPRLPVLLVAFVFVSPRIAAAAEPSALVEGFVRSFNAKDANAFGALFTDDADWVNVVGIHLTSGAQIKKEHADAFATFFKNVTLASTASTVRILRPDVAVVHFNWLLTGETAYGDGKPLPPRRGIIQILAFKRGDSWKIAAGQNTNCKEGVPCPTPP